MENEIFVKIIEQIGDTQRDVLGHVGSINTSIKYINENIDRLDKKLDIAIEQHEKNCPARIAKKNQGAWFRWALSLPLAGLIIDKIYHFWIQTPKGN